MNQPHAPVTRRSKHKTGARQLLREETLLHFFVRLFYLAGEDSFILEWLLPHPDSPGRRGTKPYTNPEEVNASFRHCVAELDKARKKFSP